MGLRNREGEAETTEPAEGFPGPYPNAVRAAGDLEREWLPKIAETDVRSLAGR